MWVILKVLYRYRFLTCLIPSSMLFTFIFLIILTISNITCQDMVLSNTMPLMCMRSQHRATFLYLSRTPLGKFGNMIVSTWCTCGGLFYLSKVTHWVNIYSQPFRNLLTGLVDYLVCCFQMHAIFALLFGRWCDGIVLRHQPYVHHGQCTVSSFIPLFKCYSVNCSKWCEHLFVVENVPNIVVE